MTDDPASQSRRHAVRGRHRHRRARELPGLLGGASQRVAVVHPRPAPPTGDAVRETLPAPGIRRGRR